MFGKQVVVLAVIIAVLEVQTTESFSIRRMDEDFVRSYDGPRGKPVDSRASMELSRDDDKNSVEEEPPRNKVGRYPSTKFLEEEDPVKPTRKERLRSPLSGHNQAPSVDEDRPRGRYIGARYETLGSFQRGPQRRMPVYEDAASLSEERPQPARRFSSEKEEDSRPPFVQKKTPEKAREEYLSQLQKDVKMRENSRNTNVKSVLQRGEDYLPAKISGERKFGMRFQKSNEKRRYDSVEDEEVPVRNSPIKNINKDESDELTVKRERVSPRVYDSKDDLDEMKAVESIVESKEVLKPNKVSSPTVSEESQTARTPSERVSLKEDRVVNRDEDKADSSSTSAESTSASGSKSREDDFTTEKYNLLKKEIAEGIIKNLKNTVKQELKAELEMELRKSSSYKL